MHRKFLPRHHSCKLFHLPAPILTLIYCRAAEGLFTLQPCRLFYRD